MKRGWATELIEPWLKLPSEPPSLPAGSSGSSRVFRASEAFLRYRYVGATARAVCGFLAVLVAGFGVGVTKQWHVLWAVGGLAAIGAVESVVAFAAVRLDWDLRFYAITDRALRIREGAWIMRELTLTFLNVQNVTIEQGPIERLFGIANVVVETAGGGTPRGGVERGSTRGHRAVLRGVANADEVRDLIRARLESARRDSGLGDLDDASSQLDLLREIRAETSALATTVRARAS